MPAGGPSDQARVDAACHRFLTDPALEPLVKWWELQLLNSVVPPGPVDPLRLAMRQGDGERLTGIKHNAAAHKRRADAEKG